MLKEGKIVNNRQRNRAFAQGASGDAAVPEASVILLHSETARKKLHFYS